MYCSECGREVPPGALFCPSCGRYLDSQYHSANTASYGNSPYVQHSTRITDRKSGKKLVAIAVVAIVILAAFAVSIASIVNTKGPLDGQSFYGDFDTEPLEGGNRAIYLDPSFDTSSGTLSIIDYEADGKTYSDCIRLTLSEGIASSYTKFKYTLEGTSIGSIEKEEPYLTIYRGTVGEFTVTVECKDSLGIVQKTCVFKFESQYHIVYKWKYQGGLFCFETFVPYDDVSPYLPTTEEQILERNITDYSKVTDFVVKEDTVINLEKNLRELYIKAFTTCDLDQDYADYLLAFVQINFNYVMDDQLYGVTEYFAYPAETVIYGAGDCEDTSILCASLYKAAGYSCAVLLLPGHAMAGVTLDTYDAPGLTGSYEVLKQTVSGKTYYACETTVDSFQEVGISSTSGEKYSRSLDKGLTGYGSYTFYPAD